VQSIREALETDLRCAKEALAAATKAFDAVCGEIPSGMPHPDGVARIKSASKELHFRREQFMTSLSRLNGFTLHGIVPDDLLKKFPQTEHGSGDKKKSA
jgi:hypothetical protein